MKFFNNIYFDEGISFQRKMERIERQGEKFLRKRKLKEAKEKYRVPKKKMTTDKFIAKYLFVVLNIVLIYAMVAMWVFQDLSCLGLLITDVAAQIVTYYIYSIKATKENTSGGIVFETAMAQLHMNNVDDAVDDVNDINGFADIDDVING